MERWLLTFFVGSILSLFIPIVPTFFYVILFTFCFCITFCFKKLRNLSGFFFGAALIINAGYDYLLVWEANHLRPAAVAYQTVEAVGRIATIPQCQLQKCRFEFEITQLNAKALSPNLTARLYWHDSQAILMQGQHWSLRITIKPAHGLANPKGFSYQSFLRHQNIHATGYVKQPQLAVLRVDNSTIRHRWFSGFQRVLATHPLSPIIEALTFGERGNIEQAQWQILNTTQIQHLISISGLHIGLVAAFTYFILQVLSKVLPFASKSSFVNRVIITGNFHIYSLLISLSVATFYAYLAGFSIPTLRAIIAIVLIVTLRLLRIELNRVSILLIGIFLILVNAPLSIISISFWLSFYAVASIFFLLWRYPKWFQGQDKKEGRWNQYVWVKCKQLLILQTALTLLMMPIVAIISAQISLVAIVANLVAVPIISFLVLPLSLLMLVASFISDVLVECIAIVNFAILEQLWRLLAYLSGLSWATIALSTLNVVALFSIFLVLFITVINRRLFLPTLLSMSMVWTLLYKVNLSEQPDWRVRVFDVGQGLAVLIEQGKHVALYDTGAAYRSGFSSAQAAIIPYLKGAAIEQIDWLFISHNDNDHAGGYQVINHHFIVNRELHNINQSQRSLRCIAGDRYQWFALTFEVLSPEDAKGDDNSDSCVIRINDGTHQVLLTGDIDRFTEQQLINRARSDKEISLHADVLIAPHHGSKTSSSIDFIDKVSPRHVIFSAGYLHHWKMPNKAVVERYKQRQILTYNTASDGMIIISSRENILKVDRFRQDINWFWFVN
ncbi:DNA internalization-related competence protein ComEC/Rec2 [Thalassotalea ganghwensis]